MALEDEMREAEDPALDEQITVLGDRMKEHHAQSKKNNVSSLGL